MHIHNITCVHIATLLRCASILIGHSTKQTPSGDVRHDGENCLCCVAL